MKREALFQRADTPSMSHEVDPGTLLDINSSQSTVINVVHPLLETLAGRLFLLINLSYGCVTDDQRPYTPPMSLSRWPWRIGLSPCVTTVQGIGSRKGPSTHMMVVSSSWDKESCAKSGR